MLRLTSYLLLVFLYLTSPAFGVHLHGRDINEPLLESYDYIVVGCGISGLVVSNRLSEIASRTVLCIEAGDALVLPPRSRVLSLSPTGTIMSLSFRIQSTLELTSAAYTTGTSKLYRKPSSMVALDQCPKAKSSVVAVF